MSIAFRVGVQRRKPPLREEYSLAKLWIEDYSSGGLYDFSRSQSGEPLRLLVAETINFMLGGIKFLSALIQKLHKKRWIVLHRCTLSGCCISKPANSEPLSLLPGLRDGFRF